MTYRVYFILILCSMDTPELQSCVFSTLPEYGQKFAQICNGNLASESLCRLAGYLLKIHS